MVLVDIYVHTRIQVKMLPPFKYPTLTVIQQPSYGAREIPLNALDQLSTIVTFKPVGTEFASRTFGTALASANSPSC